MTERKARTEKVMLLGVDGLDPRLTRKYVDEGIMPNNITFSVLAFLSVIFILLSVSHHALFC